jgi:hypothetical protein
MSKRFPIPAFDYAPYKNMEWAEPKYVSQEEQARLIDAAKSGAGDAFGCHPVQADPSFYERFKLRGSHTHALMCLLPPREIKLLGRSHAWSIQQALVVDSLDGQRSNVMYEWKTPRPMNTRLGPDEGVTFAGKLLYVVCSHRYSDYWIVNRTLVGDKNPPNQKGFAILSASDDDINDFHACNLSFTWS